MCFPSVFMIFSTTEKLLTTFDPCISYWTLIYLTIWTWTLYIDWNMAGSVRTCCVPNCAKTRADNIVLHAFPDPEKEEKRFVTWVKAVGDSISSLDYKYIHKNRKICHDHFEEKYLTWSRRLSSGAVPTLHMPGFQIERVVLKEVTNICNKGLTEINSTTSPKSTLENYRMAPSSSANIGTHIAASHLESVVASTSADLTLKPETTILKDIVAVKQPLKVNRKDTKFLDDTKVLKQMVDKLTQKKNKYASRLKKALKLTENSTFQKILNKSTSLAAIFFTMQFREVRKMKMGRRFTEQEKIMALSIYKQGPKCYRLLSKIFVLPSPLTLSRLIKQVDLRAGINEKLFDVMMKKIKNMNTDEKLCILLFDEIAISPHFEYNQRKDAISGFVTNGTTIQNKIADHALVFMVRGVLRNYKQPVAYTFCAGSTKKEELAVLIKTVIKKLHSVGLRVLATVCDQGASNVSCIKYLIAETRSKYLKINQELKRDVFEVEDKEIIPLYDPPHLIKGIRNNLLEKNLKCTINASSKTAKWQHIIKLYKEDPSYSGIKLLKNLTEEHINPEKCKMKVKFATQVFSQKVASTMGYLASKEILPKECQETADVLLFFDELFDSVNGSKENSEKRRGKPLLCALTPNSSHNAIWAKAKTVLSSMKFIKNGKELNIPTVSNWLHTINNFEYLRDVLFNNYKMKSIWTRHYNQDPLENFFGAIRSHGCRNINPSPEGFEIAFASLLISNLTGTHSPGSNCEQDACKNMFKSMKDIFKVSERNNMSQSIDLSYLPSNIFVAYEDKKKDPRILAQLEYVTGYLLRKTKKHVFNNCISCKGILFNKQEDNEYLRAREFTKKRQFLEYPSEPLVRMFSGIQDILMWVLKNHGNIENIKMFTKTILYMEIDTNFITCEKHKKQNTEYIFDLGCRFFIHNWCREINNILKGRRKDAVGDDYIKNLALQYVKKRRKCNYK